MGEFKQVLSLSYRPKSLDRLVGQEKLVEKIRGRYAKKRLPQAWMFVGETGAGKTTLARIIACALQCSHQDSFGNPCRECLRKRRQFDIAEVNAGDITGIEPLRQAVSGSDFDPRPGSKARVYILDEAHRLSVAAQTLLLKYLEDCPRTTYWIICTTAPEKLLRTIRRRCAIYTVPSLSPEGLHELVKRALKKGNSDRDVSDLAEALMENQIYSPGLVMQAVEKYAAGESAEESARIEISTEIDSKALCRAVVKGQWEDVAKQLKEAKPEDARALVSAVAGYLREILFDEELGPRGKTVAKAIDKLVASQAMGEAMQLSALTAALYQLCEPFSNQSF